MNDSMELVYLWEQARVRVLATSFVHEPIQVVRRIVHVVCFSASRGWIRYEGRHWAFSFSTEENIVDCIDGLNLHQIVHHRWHLWSVECQRLDAGCDSSHDRCAC